MLDYEISGPFNKDRKLMQKRHNDIHKLRDVMSMLIQEIPLFYRIDKENRRVIFYRTGSHSDLF